MGRGKHVRRSSARSHPRFKVSLVGGTLLGVLMFAGVAIASLPGQHLLDTPGEEAELNDGAFIEQSFLAVVGTGNLNPFLRVQNTPTEDGFNTSHRLSGADKIVYHDGAPTDAKTDPSTQDLLLNTVPIVAFDGGLFREFRLDLNEDQSTGVLVSLDAISIWVGPHAFINELDISDGSYSHYSSGNDQTADGTATGTEVWSLAAGWWVVIDSSLSSGSGNLGDARLLVPVENFGTAGEECPYNPTAPCDWHVYFYSEFGAAESAESTFEEWAVRDVPFITKTVETSLTRTYPWTIEKSVDPAEHDLFDGDSADSTYEITVTKGDPVDSDWTVSGLITITNPGDEVSISGVEDLVDAAGGGTIAADVQCGVTFPHILDTDDTLVCTYEAAADPGDTENPFGDTNVATFTYTLEGNTDAGAVIEDVDFSSADVTEVNGTVDVTDQFDGGTVETIATGVTETTTLPTYDRTFDCSDVTFGAGETTSNTVNYPNTATVKTGETVHDTDNESVDVTCYRPTIEKDAATSFTRTFGWTIEKSVDPAEHHLFDGDNDDSTYEITVTKDAGTDTDHVVSGSILIGNPHPSDDLVITDLTDQLTGDATAVTITDCTGTDVTYAGGVLTIAAGETADCDYTASVPGKDATLNTASFTLFGNPYSDSADVTWGDPTTEVNDTVDVIDEFDGGAADPIGTVSTTTTFAAYNRNFDCSDVTFESGATVSDTVQYPNTASVKSGDTVLDSDSETVEVTCYRPSIEKDASTSFTRTFGWTIEKTVDPASHDLFDGDSADSTYEITVTKDAGTDTGHQVSGSIMITNPHPTDDMVITDLADQLTGDATPVSITGCAGTGVTYVGGVLTIPAGETADCDYTASVPGQNATLNTASFTLFGNPYSDSADVTWGDPTTEVNDTVDVIDEFDGGSAETIATGISSTTTLSTYDRTFDCEDVVFGSGETTSNTEQYPNVASVKSGDTVLDTDDALVEVTCYRLSVSKTVETSFTRDYDWSISKGRFIAAGEVDDDGDPLTLTLDEGETHVASYEVVVTLTGSADVDHHVNGVITVVNPAPIAADDVVVTDVLSLTGAVAVDCDPGTGGAQNTVDIPASDSVDCTYGSDVTDGSQQTNTATATLFGIGYDSDAEDVIFGDPTTELDECIDVVDDAGTPGNTSDDIDLGTVCVDDLVGGSKTLTYTIQIGPFSPCGQYTFTNTASFTTSDQDGEGDDTGSDTYTVTIDVPCPTGCTLTLGYWQTHSKYGPAPHDDTWDLVGEDTGFFMSTSTWFEAIQANPQGNAYWILAQQYVATQLNILTGADVPPDVLTAFNNATALFNTYTPEQIDAMKGNDPVRQQFIAAADVLADYNEGLIGPGHCDEEETLLQASTIPLALTGLAIALMAAAAQKGRYARRDLLLD